MNSKSTFAQHNTITISPYSIIILKDFKHGIISYRLKRPKHICEKYHVTKPPCVLVLNSRRRKESNSHCCRGGAGRNAVAAGALVCVHLRDRSRGHSICPPHHTEQCLSSITDARLGPSRSARCTALGGRLEYIHDNRFIHLQRII